MPCSASHQCTKMRTLYRQSISLRSLVGQLQPGRAHGPPRFDRMSRSPRFPMYFSAACLLGGCIIFAGALHAHNAVFDG